MFVYGSVCRLLGAHVLPLPPLPPHLGFFLPHRAASREATL